MPEEGGPCTTFDQLFNLPTQLYPAAFEVMNLAGDYVVFEDNTVRTYNWDGFRNAVSARRSTPSIAMQKLQSSTITNSTASVEDMAEKIAQFLIDTFQVKTEMDGIRAQIKTAFENLAEEKREGMFRSFKEEKHGSSWEYRVVFAFPNQDEWFRALVSTIRLSADIVNAKGWFGITKKSKHNFSAHITAMDLVVNKEFRREAA